MASGTVRHEQAEQARRQQPVGTALPSRPCAHPPAAELSMPLYTMVRLDRVQA